MKPQSIPAPAEVQVDEATMALLIEAQESVRRGEALTLEEADELEERLYSEWLASQEEKLAA